MADAFLDAFSFAMGLVAAGVAITFVIYVLGWIFGGR